MAGRNLPIMRKRCVMSDPVIRRVRRSIDEAKNRGGMQAGMPKVTIDAGDAERLCIVAGALATTQAENEALRAQIKKTEAKRRVPMDMCRDLRARVAELTGEVAIQNELMQQMVYTEPTVNRKTIADSVALAGPALLLRKQAEAVEDAVKLYTHKMTDEFWKVQVDLARKG